MAFLISFGADSELLQDITGSPRVLQDGLNRMKLNGGFSGINSGPVPTMSHARGTVLYDAVYVASNDMLAKEVGRKAIVLITDGEDEGSTETEKAAIEAAQKADAIIYGILYVDRQFYGGFGGGYSGEAVLKQMSEETGGRLFQVDRKNTLESIFDQIQQEMRTQYAIGYTPTNGKKDGVVPQDRSAHFEQGSEGAGAQRLLRAAEPKLREANPRTDSAPRSTPQPPPPTEASERSHALSAAHSPAPKT